MKPNIGIIGFGFLGRALAHGFNLHSCTFFMCQKLPFTKKQTINKKETLYG